MRFIIACVAALGLCATAHAQSTGGFTGKSSGNNSPLSASALNAAFALKTDYNPTGTMTTGTVTASAGNNLVIATPSTSQLLVFKNGVSGTIMMKLGGSASGIETDQTVTLNPPGTPGNYGFVMNDTWTGSSSSPTFMNILQAFDNMANTSTQGTAILSVSDVISSATATGAKNALVTNMSLTHASGNTTGVGGSYSAAQMTAVTAVNDNGTGTTVGTSRGLMYGANPVGHLQSGATNWTQLTAEEGDCAVDSGASVLDMVCHQIVMLGSHAVAGTRDDVMFSLNGQGGTTGVGYGLEFGRKGGSWPFSSASTLIGANANGGYMPTALGIDWTGVTFATAAIKTPGFTIDGTGNATALSYRAGSSAGVSCAAGTVSLSTLVVTSGIVTHC